ncbi:MAG: thioredoxin fold domain-containing protein [Lysobacteraceae bacterium]
MNKLLIAIVLGSVGLSACSAAPAPSKAATGTVEAAKPAMKPASAPVAPGEAAIRKGIAQLAPTAQIDFIRAAPITGLSEVSIEGQLLYITNDGKYVVSGSIIETATKHDLTENSKASVRREAFKTITPAQTIVFAPANPKYTVNVFTDIDCGYCRKLHSQMADYNRQGIAVRYLFFPRSGLVGESFDKAVAVWCSPDRRRALTDAKNGISVTAKNCTNPITMDYNLGRRIGIDATPAVYTQDGVQIGGYIPPQQMRQTLDKLAAQPQS